MRKIFCVLVKPKRKNGKGAYRDLLILIIGGAAGGKSELAEQICGRSGNGRKVYIAAMAAQDAESKQRIAKHREMRKDKGFTTIEHALCGQYSQLVFSEYETALLECVSNLLANEMYIAGESAEGAASKIIEYIGRIGGGVQNTVVVSNDIFGGAGDHDAFTHGYIKALGSINRILAQKADVVVESVCGIPVFLKGEIT